MAKLNYSIALNLLTNGVKKGAQEVTNTFKRMGNSIRGALGNLGVGLGITSFGYQMIEAGKNFEDAMARVRAVSNASAKDFERMTKTAKELGATTKYSATEAANALENLVRNGLNPGQASEALPRVLKLAQANAVELAEAADIVTNTMNEFGLATKDLDKINDTLSSTAGHSATNLTDLGIAMTTAAPLAKNLGINIQDTSAALGVLANVGIKGADAGTALRQIFMGLSTSTPESEKALKKYGLTINQSTIQAKGLTKTLQEMFESGISKDNQALGDVFGRRAFAGAASLINSYEKFIGLNATLSQSSGETARMFEQGTGTMQNDIKSLASAWEGFQIKVFNSSEGFYTKPVEALTALIRFATENLPKVATAIGLAFVYSKVAKFWTQLKTDSASAFATAVATAKGANAKMNALTRQRGQLEKQIASLKKQIAKSSADERYFLEVQLEQKIRELKQNSVNYDAAMEAKRMAVEKARQLQSLSGWRLYFAQLKSGFTTLATSFKAIWSTVGPMLIFTILTEIISKISEIIDAQSSLKNVARDYATELAKATHTKEINQLERLKKQYNDAHTSAKQRTILEGKISEVIGQHVKGAKDVNRVLEERIGLLKEAAKAEFYQNQSLESQSKMEEIEAKYGGDPTKHSTRKNWDDKRGVWGRFNLKADLDYESDLSTYKKEKWRRDNAEGHLKKINLSGNNSGNNGGGGSRGGSGSASTGTTKTDEAAESLKNIEESYTESLKRLNFEKRHNLKDAHEYGKALNDLIASTYEQTQTSKYSSVRNSAFAKKMGEVFGNLPSKDLEKFADIADRVSKAEIQYEKDINAGVKNQQDLDDAMHDVYKSAIEEASTLDGLTDIQKNMVNKWQGRGQLLEGVSALAGAGAHNPKNQNSTRDTTFDYKATKKERLELDLDYAKEQLEALQEQAKNSLFDLSGAINEKMKEMNSLSDALKLAQFQEDIKQARQDIQDNFFGSFGELEGITSSISNLISTMDDPDVSGWEEFLAIMTTIGSVVQSVSAIYTAFQTILTALNIIQGANAGSTAAQASASAADATAKTADATAAVAQNTANAAAIPINKAAAAAAEQLAASNIFLAHSMIPFVGPAIATGYVAAMAATLATLKASTAATAAFANGGVVKGLPFDHSLAKVSDGEMVLNKGQQSNLWHAIKNGQFGGGVGGQVDFVIRGSNLVGTLKNYSKEKSKTGKNIKL